MLEMLGRQAVTTADIEDGRPSIDPAEHLLDAGLRAASGGGEWPGQALIECAIDL
jgi:hypothetical protein